MFKKGFKNIGYFIIVFLVIGLVGCKSHRISEGEKVDIPKFTEVITLKREKDSLGIYNIENGDISKTMETKDVVDVKYNNKNSAYVFINIIEKGKELNKNKITIIKNGKQTILENFYSASDIDISKEGNKIAYRSFKQDSLQSAEGMKIYDLENKKEIKIKSDVLVSGNLFKWLNEDEILYYGINSEKENKAKIYKYNVKENKEEVYVDNIEGICTYFMPNGDNVLLLSSQGDKFNLSYYNKKDNSFKKISEEVNQIYKGTKSIKNMYFLGKNDLENKDYLYKIDGNTLNLTKLTYDFPPKIDINGGIVSDKNGNIYFSGYEDLKEQPLNEIYVYKEKDDTVEIISDKENSYHIMGER
ncbi:hypothetical protein FDC45_13155 [Clostridium botulinum]|uniref:Lipoprotein n=1 Tax=Clostridium botulinum TaxID=1491 RepID=A0A846JA09_CLOBO|nr:hypothetical protein [Clostridium botulinum]ACA53609.1 putative lipoprotein [Clostridium botulinum A3 str. Loch Maree]NFH66170.1 hypothetical protein [Clostridium botulinum]NFJ08683.1 hypothetical protein [Clostridium botulinum]NFK15079.1 hypothetical protein [Clostridium botulinum]NFM93039.1 hypothetical protein [Clostridium botulinum]